MRPFFIFVSRRDEEGIDVVAEVPFGSSRNDPRATAERRSSVERAELALERFEMGADFGVVGAQ